MRSGVVARGSFSQSHSTDGDSQRLTNAPRQIGSLRVHVPLHGDRLGVGLQQSFIGDRLSHDGSLVPRAATTDATLVWRASGHLSLSGNVRNLFDAAVYAPTSDAFVQSRLPLDGRTLYLNAGWQF